MLTQAQQGQVWGEHCYKGPFLTVPLYGAGHASINPAIADAVSALSACLKVFDYKSEAADTGGFCCRAKTGNPNSTSNHGRGIAIDINWKANPYGAHLVTNMPTAMIQAICGIRTNNGAQVWNWGGNWSGNKDAMHFEIVCTPGDLLSGINQNTIPIATPTGVAIQNVPTQDQITAFYTAVRTNEAAKLAEQWGHLDVGWPVAGVAPNKIEAAMVQQALNLILPNTTLTVDGAWGPASAAALREFQTDMNALRPGSIPQAEIDSGTVGNDTKWWIGVRIFDIAAGKP